MTPAVMLSGKGERDYFCCIFQERAFIHIFSKDSLPVLILLLYSKQ